MNILGILLVVGIPILCGAYLAALFINMKNRPLFYAVGTVVGIPLFTTINFLLSLGGRISWMRVLGTLLILALAAFVIKEKYKVKKPKSSTGPKNLEGWFKVVGLVLTVGFFWVCMAEVMHEKPDGIYVGFEKNLGDLPFHFHLASSFLFDDNIPPQNPIFSGLPLRYPYLSDYYSAVVWFVTNDLEFAFEIPGLVLGIAFVILFFHLVWDLTKSFWAAWFSPLIFLLNGGFGFLHYAANRKSLTINGDFGLDWANVMYALWIPQRSLQFAFPMLVFFLMLLLEASREKNIQKFLALAVCALPLPLFHGHAIIILFIWALALFAIYPSWRWAALAIPLGAGWIPIVLFLSGKIGKTVTGGPAFLHINLGWMSDGLKILPFWLRNTGLFFPLCVALLLWLGYRRDWMRISREWMALLVASVGIFILGNVVVFAPWDWDNIKILIFGFLGLVPLCALGIAFLIESKKPLLISASVMLVVLLIASGALDIRRAVKGNSEDHRLFTTGEVQAAESLRPLIPKHAVFLVRPTYNEPFLLTGRPFMLGYEGHIWSHGLPLDERKKDLLAIGKGEPNALDLLKKYNVDYVVLGWREQEIGFNREFFAGHFPLLENVRGSDYNAAPFAIYRVRE